MARSTLEEREDHVLKGHATTIPHRLAFERFRNRINYIGNEIAHYLGTLMMGQYWAVVESGPPVGNQPSASGSGQPPGVTIDLRDVVCGRGAATADRVPVTAGISLAVPPGQSVALLSKPKNDAADLLDVIAGLTRPRSGQVLIDGVAVDRLGRAELDRYHAGRGLISARFPLLPSLSVTDNVLAPLLAGRVDAVTRERAVALLELTGGARLTGRVDRLAAEDQWRIMVARALVSSPRLVLAEDPASSLDSRPAARVLDVLMDAHTTFGFTLVLTAGRLSTAVRCHRQVSLVDGIVTEDEITSGDDAWTRGRIDRIG
jgi:predicted ABC-type transport system involved in lysophospholipase L1 biosynthesis ATPase subunit